MADKQELTCMKSRESVVQDIIFLDHCIDVTNRLVCLNRTSVGALGRLAGTL